MTQCEGYRRNGNAWSLGPVTWVRCKEEAVVIVTVIQDGKTETFPACMTCWNECVDTGILVSAEWTKDVAKNFETPMKDAKKKATK